MDHNELTADKFATIYPQRSTRRPSNMRFSDLFLVKEEKPVPAANSIIQNQIKEDPEDVDMGGLFGDDDDY